MAYHYSDSEDEYVKPVEFPVFDQPKLTLDTDVHGYLEWRRQAFDWMRLTTLALLGKRSLDVHDAAIRPPPEGGLLFARGLVRKGDCSEHPKPVTPINGKVQVRPRISGQVETDGTALYLDFDDYLKADEWALGQIRLASFVRRAIDKDAQKQITSEILIEVMADLDQRYAPATVSTAIALLNARRRKQAELGNSPMQLLASLTRYDADLEWIGARRLEPREYAALETLSLMTAAQYDGWMFSLLSTKLADFNLDSVTAMLRQHVARDVLTGEPLRQPDAQVPQQQHQPSNRGRGGGHRGRRRGH